MLKCLPAWCMLARLMIKRHYKSFVNDTVLNSNREALYGNNTLLFYSLCWLLFYCCLAEIKRRRKRKRISFILKRHFRSPTFNFSFLRLHCFTFRFFVHCSNSQRRFCLDNFFFPFDFSFAASIAFWVVFLLSFCYSLPLGCMNVCKCAHFYGPFTILSFTHTKYNSVQNNQNNNNKYVCSLFSIVFVACFLLLIAQCTIDVTNLITYM